MAHFYRAINQSKGTVLCEKLEVAETVAEKSRGLLGRDRLDSGAGMLFEGMVASAWLHMFFMRFPIDIVFLDKVGRVMRINANLRPWQVSSVVLGARKALEIEAGATTRSGTSLNDIVTLERVLVS